MLGAVQIQRLDRCPAGGGNTVQTECHPAEVIDLRQSAIFTAVLCPAGHTFAQAGGDGYGSVLQRFNLRSQFQDRQGRGHLHRELNSTAHDGATIRKVQNVATLSFSPSPTQNIRSHWIFEM